MTTLLKTQTSALILHEIDADICQLIETCVRTIDIELDVNPEIIVYGKACHQHRSVGFYSDTSRGYNYSTSITPSKSMHPCLRELLEYINTKFNYSYNGILINKYTDGLDYIGKHSDDEILMLGSLVYRMVPYANFVFAINELEKLKSMCRPIQLK